MKKIEIEDAERNKIILKLNGCGDKANVWISQLDDLPIESYNIPENLLNIVLNEIK